MIIKSIYPENSSIISQYCKYFFRGEQSSGEIANLVTGKATANKNAGFLDATLWANSGFATIGGGAGNYCTLVPSTHDLTLNGYSLVVTARVKKVAAAFPAGEQHFIASYDPGVAFGGIIMSCRTDGSVRLYCNSTDNTTVNVTSAANALTDGSTANECHAVFIFPRNTGYSCFCATNGIERNSASATTIATKSLSGHNTMRMGVPLGGGALDAYRIAAFAAYAVPVDIQSLNRNQIYDWAYRHPATPMPDWVFA